MKSLKFKINPLFLAFGVILVYFNLGYMFLCYLIAILLHEFGHAYVAKKLGYKLNTISLMPYGAELSGEKTVFTERDEILIAVAGPFVNLCLIIITIALWWLYPSYYFYSEMFVVANLASLLFNLLPVFPLDGGRVLLAYLSTKLERKLAYKIVKIVGVTIALVFLILFLISVFYYINFTFFVASFFLMAGSLSSNKNITYNSIITTLRVKNLDKKGKTINNFAISEEASLLATFKSLNASCINEIHIMNKQMEVRAVINEKRLNELVSMHPFNKKLKEVI